MYKNIVNNRVGPGKVDKFENARGMHRIGRALEFMQFALHVDEDSLTRLNVAHQFKILRIQRNALRRHHIFGAVGALAPAINQRADTVRIPKTEQPITGNHCDSCVAATATPMNRGNCLENILGGDPQPAQSLQFMGKYVEQNLRVGRGIDMAQILAVEIPGQLLGIGKIAVVRQCDAIG